MNTVSQFFLSPRVLIAVAAILCPPAGIAAPSIQVSADREDSLYEVGEEVSFSIRVTEGEGTLEDGEVSWTLSMDGYGKLAEGTEAVGSGKAVEVTGSLSRPGFLLLTAVLTGADGKKVTAYGSAGISPLEIEPSLPVPGDFDEFWEAQKEKLAKVPMKVISDPQRLQDSDAARIEAFDLQIEGETGGPPVSGYFALPKSAAPKSLPAVLWVHGAGVRSSSLPNALNGARRGFLSMDINAHGIPNGKPEGFYRELSGGTLKTYRYDGRENRETIYFRGMLLRLVRAIDYLSSRPEWDGEVMAVIGHSQGGLQALAAGGLDSRVTFIGAGVPAGCDHTGMEVDRISGWPKLVPVTDGIPDPDVLEASRYIDAVNFASRCRADAIVSAGFIDRTCPPTSVYSAYNVLPGKKTMLNRPAMGHAAPADIKEEFWKALEAHVEERAGAGATAPGAEAPGAAAPGAAAR